jgi:Co/Zn/Cd efflux system component
VTTVAPTFLLTVWVGRRVGYLPACEGTGGRLDSPVLIADGAHACADAYVSLAVIATDGVVVIGLPIADPLIGLAIILVILRITWQSSRTVREDGHTHN